MCVLPLYLSLSLLSPPPSKMSLNELINPQGAGVAIKPLSCVALTPQVNVGLALGATATTLAVNLEHANSIISIPAMSNACAISLPTPAVAAQCVFRFRATGTVGNAVTIASGTASSCFGVVTLGPSTMTQLSVPGHTNVVFTATAVAGDWLDYESDGTHYFVKGSSFASAGFSRAS